MTNLSISKKNEPTTEPNFQKEFMRSSYGDPAVNNLVGIFENRQFQTFIEPESQQFVEILNGIRLRLPHMLQNQKKKFEGKLFSEKYFTCSMISKHSHH